MIDDAEVRYLNDLRSDRRTSDLAGRLQDLRDAGYSIIDIAEGIGVTKQWLYAVLSKHVGAVAPADAPPITPIEEAPAPAQPIRPDRAKLPGPLADGISALWRVAVRDHSAGKSPVAQTLDVALALLTRRGVPSLAIAEDVGMTHRSVLMRLERARQRGTLPDGLPVEMLHAPKYEERRTVPDRLPGREAFGVFQVVNSTFPRFYTMRDSQDHTVLIDPYRLPSHLDLEDVEFIHSEDEFIQTVADASPDDSPIYAAPAHWLYLESVPSYVWLPQHYDLLQDFFPKAVRPTDPKVLTCLTDPKTILKSVPPIDWNQNVPDSA